MPEHRVGDKSPGGDGIIDGENIDTSQHSGSGNVEQTRAWQQWALRHIPEMRVARTAKLLDREWRNVAEHLMAVNAFAMTVSRKLAERGVPIDMELVDQASMLHDVSKRVDKERGVSYAQEHGASALEILLREAGYNNDVFEAASYTGRVEAMFIDDPSERQAAIAATPTEHLIVAYSDARIRNTDVVSLEEARDKNKLKVPADAPIYDKWYDYYSDVERYLTGLAGDDAFSPAAINETSVLATVSAGEEPHF